MKNLRKKLMLATTLAVGSLGLFGAAALGAFGPDTSSTLVSTIAPAASAVLGETKAGDKLKDILDGLVGKGVITQQQATTILATAKDATAKHARHGKIVRELFGESAKYLGLDQKDLAAKLPGSSLGKIADGMTDKGKNKAGLVKALLAAGNEDITKAASDKKITDDQAKKLRDGLAAEITKFVERTWPTKPAAAPHAGAPHVKAFLGDMVQTARDYLGGMTVQDVMAALRSGKSLGDLADEKGKGRANLISTLTLAATTRIDTAVTENKLTKDQATALKAKVAMEIESFVNRKHTPKTGTANGTTTKKP